MSQEDLLIHIFCLIDDLLKAVKPPRLRAHGPTPRLADSEVIALACFGELLGVDTDKGIFALGRRHFLHLFPALGRVNRTTFLRQAANLWGVVDLLQERLAEGFLAGRPQPPLWVIDSFPLPACRFARAPSCKRLAGVAAFGYDPTARAVFYGLKVHLRAAGGVVAQLELAPAGVHDRDMAPELMPQGVSLALADRNYWSPPLKEELAAEGKRLLAPFKIKRLDRKPLYSALLSKLRQGVEPLIGQLAGRLNIKRMWARDLWHLCARLYRKALAHTTAVVINDMLGHEATCLELLLAE